MMDSLRQARALSWKQIVILATCTGIVAVGLVSSALAQGAANNFAVLSPNDVSLKNRVNISQVAVTHGACPGAVGCPGSIGGATVLMGRGNAAAPDTISGDVIASATASQDLN